MEYAGFQTVERPNIVLEVGKELSVDFSLQPGEQTRTITVSAEAPMVDTSNSTLGGTLGPGTIQDLPLNGHNFMNLLQLRPGVTIYPGGGAWTQTTNGLRPEHNVYILDGITAMEPLGGQSTINSVSLAGDAATLLPVDTIQEFNVQQNPKAEYGWKPGSITSIALKSGTNAWHGTGAAFGRTDAADARNPFLAGDQKQEINLQQFGGTAGGPIKKDKLFFFGAYEGQRYDIGNPTALTYPTMAANALPIAGQTTSIVAACKNVLASGKALSPTTLKISGLDANCGRTSGYSIFDLPSAFQREVDAGGAQSASVTGSLSTHYGVDGGLAKLDYHIGEKDTLNGKYFIGTHTGLVINNQTITQPYWAPTDSATVQFLGTEWVHILNSALVNSLRFGYNHFYQKFETSDCVAGENGAPDYGINFGYGTSKPNCGFTNISLNGFTGSIGCCSSFPKYYGPDNIFEVIEGLSYLRGKHSFKVGAEFHSTSIGDGGTFNRGRGQVTFSTLENFMTGTPTTNNQILLGDPRRNPYNRSWAAYIQDDWRVTAHFTLNLGVRYEYVGALHEGNDMLANFIPGTGFTQLGKNTDELWHPDKNNFAPRLGFAWDVGGNGKTVIRGGINQIYITPGWWIFLSQQNQNNPTVGLGTNPSGFVLCRGAVNINGAGCAPGVATDPTIGTIQASGLPLQPASASGVLPGQVNWNQSSAVYGGAIYPSSSDTSLLKCGTNRFCTVQATDPNLKNGYVTSWSLGVQRQVAANLSLEANYVGNHATKLLGLNYTNTPPIGAGYCLGFSPAMIAAVAAVGPPCPTTITSSTGTNANAIQLSRPLSALYPYLSYIYTVGNPYFSNYNGLQVALTQRNSHGLSYTLGYTYSHALDECSGERAGPCGTPFDFRHDYASSDFDIRHRFTGTITYALPARKGFAQMAEGWKVTSIVTIQSALPWGIYGNRGSDPAGIAEFNTGASAGDQWNFYGNPDNFSGRKTNPIPFYTGAQAVNVPACTSKVGSPGSLGYVSLQKWGCFVSGNSVMVPPALGSYGNMTRNYFRGNGIHYWDASVEKDFHFGERFTAEFRIEAFNVLNQTQYGNPQFNGAGANSPFGSPAIFGASQATPDVSNNNPSLGSGGPREFQFGMKLIF